MSSAPHQDGPASILLPPPHRAYRHSSSRVAESRTRVLDSRIPSVPSSTRPLPSTPPGLHLPVPVPGVGDVFLGTNPAARPGPNSVFQMTADHTQPVPAPRSTTCLGVLLC